MLGALQSIKKYQVYIVSLFVAVLELHYMSSLIQNIVFDGHHNVVLSLLKRYSFNISNLIKYIQETIICEMYTLYRSIMI